MNITDAVVAESGGNGHGQKTFAEGLAQQSIQNRAHGIPSTMEADAVEFLFFRTAMMAAVDELPLWGTRQRDVQLRSFILTGPTLIRGVVYGHATKAKNMPWQINSDTKDDPKIEPYTALLKTAGFGRGIEVEMERLCTDYLTQDNGMFIELIPKAGRLFGTDRIQMETGDEYSFVTGPVTRDQIGSFAQLDSAQCYRTYNPEYPVIYYDPWSKRRYVLHHTRVWSAAQFEQPVELGRGRGLCALSRAYPAARILQDLEWYIHEKLTGQSPEIFVASGMPVDKLREELFIHLQEARDKGYLRFKDPMVVGNRQNIPNTPPVSLEKVGLRDVPDGFDYEQFIRLNLVSVAIAFGTTVREIGFPGLSTGETRADAEVTERGAVKKGIDDFLRTFETFVNSRIMPEKLVFEFNEVNDEEDRNRAQVAYIRAQTRQLDIISGVISTLEARELAVKEGDLPANILSAAPPVPVVPEQVKPAGGGGMVTGKQTEKEESQELEGKAKKAVNDIAVGFVFALADLIVETKNMSRSVFVGRMRTLIENFGTQAFMRGMADGGVWLASVNELEKEEKQGLNNLLLNQYSYVVGFSWDIYNQLIPIEVAIRSRIPLWANKGIAQIYEAGLRFASLNQNMIWMLGPSEKHCPSCSAATGQIHRARSWENANITPQCDNLVCGGFQCQCHLEKTDQRVSGRLDRIPTKEREKQKKVWQFWRRKCHCEECENG